MENYAPTKSACLYVGHAIAAASLILLCGYGIKEFFWLLYI